MDQALSDALVFFGATGDLAYKQIFPSLQRLAKRGKLNMCVIGVAKSGWTLEQFKAHATKSLESHGGIDPDGYKAYIAERESAFRQEWERQKQNPGSPAK